jgi:hypothetical protein
LPHPCGSRRRWVHCWPDDDCHGRSTLAPFVPASFDWPGSPNNRPMRASPGSPGNCATRTGCRRCPLLSLPTPTFDQMADCCGRNFSRTPSVVHCGVALMFRAKSNDRHRRDRRRCIVNNLGCDRHRSIADHRDARSRAWRDRCGDRRQRRAPCDRGLLTLCEGGVFSDARPPDSQANR